jgi:hypothetical protein
LWQTTKRKEDILTVLIGETDPLLIDMIMSQREDSSFDFFLSLFEVVDRNILTPEPVSTLAPSWVSLVDPHPANGCCILFTDASNESLGFEGRNNVWLFFSSWSRASKNGLLIERILLIWK